MDDLSFLHGKKVLVTGASGTVGAALVARLLDSCPGIGEVVALSNSEQEQFELAAKFPSSKYPIQCVMADIRDRDRMLVVSRGVDMIVHCAAMKHVPVAESNPIECARTNILGSQHVIEVAIANGVERVVALSTDKAVSPANVYGASKMFLERLFLSADTHSDTRFSVVRYANVFGSKGSVVPFFMQHKSKGYLPITDPSMTRFSITMDESLDLVLEALESAWGGEVLVPRAPSYRILDVAEAVAPGIECRTVGRRPGEKLHECMVANYEAENTVELNGRYIVCPAAGRWTIQQFIEKTGANQVSASFEYESGSNSEWLSVEQIRDMLLGHLT